MLAKALFFGGVLYLAVGVLALALIPASVFGWFGVEQDPLSAVFALLLSLPWSLALHLLDRAGPILSWIAAAAGIATNAFLLFYAARRLGANKA